MTNAIRTTLLAFLIAFVGVATPMLMPPQSAQAEDNSWAEILDCFDIWMGIDCVHVIDSASWAMDVTAWKFPGPAHNNMADAFRHCAWMGALATRIGSGDAAFVGILHEEYSPGPEAERRMDLTNNTTGAWIGDDAVDSGTSDTWGYVMNECESRARNFQLAGLWGKKGNYSK